MNTVTQKTRGGARPGAGRRKGPHTTVLRTVRMKDILSKRLEDEAAAAGMNFNAYLVMKLEGKAVAGNVEVPGPQLPVEAPAVVPIVEPVTAPTPVIEVIPVSATVEVKEASPEPTPSPVARLLEACAQGGSIHHIAMVTGSTVSEVKKAQMILASGNGELIARVKSGEMTLAEGVKALKALARKKAGS